MGANITNDTSISYGPLGTIQLSDGNGLFTGSSSIYLDTNTGTLYAAMFSGDGGLLSNVQGGGGGGGGTGNVLSGVPGQVAYYTGTNDIHGLSNITVDANTGLINIHTNVMMTTLTFEPVGFISNIGTTEYFPTLQAVADTGNTYSGTLTVQGTVGTTTEPVLVNPGTNIDCSRGSTFYFSGLSGDINVNFQKLFLAPNQLREMKFIVTQDGTPRTLGTIQLNGSSPSGGVFRGTFQGGHANSVDLFRVSVLNNTVLVENPVQLQ
jgi:hypothetical protein